MRRENDFYPTPRWATEVLLARVPISGVVLEPCVGRGDMAAVLANVPGVILHTNDVCHEAMTHEDATNARWWATLAPDWVVTNPPFVLAEQIVPLAVRHALFGVAMLLRLTFLEPTLGRGRWLHAHPPTRLIVLPRLSFTGDGKTDSVTCAWFVWERGAHTQQIEIVAVAREAVELLHEAV